MACGSGAGCGCTTAFMHCLTPMLWRACLPPSLARQGWPLQSVFMQRSSTTASGFARISCKHCGLMMRWAGTKCKPSLLQLVCPDQMT
jgi:hypothetical protein